LTPFCQIGITPRVNRATPLNSSTYLVTLAVVAVLALSALIARAAVPFSEATVTRLQNKVSFGEQRGGESVTRPAAVQDVIKARNFLLTEQDARAELQYADGSIVRVGQNTVFTFEADSRTLSLTKGSFIFYVPKGQGGGVIKTPSLTAAITGTVGKVSTNMIAIIEGSLKLSSGRVVVAGQFVRRNADNTLTIDWFDPATAQEGKLMSFNGPLPPFEEGLLTGKLKPDFNALVTQDSLDRTANFPSANERFFPPITKSPPDATRQNTNTFVPPPGSTSKPVSPSSNGRPGRNGNY
jgi:hypothetical protein